MGSHQVYVPRQADKSQGSNWMKKKQILTKVLTQLFVLGAGPSTQPSSVPSWCGAPESNPD